MAWGMNRIPNNAPNASLSGAISASGPLPPARVTLVLSPVTARAAALEGPQCLAHKGLGLEAGEGGIVLKEQPPPARPRAPPPGARARAAPGAPCFARPSRSGKIRAMSRTPRPCPYKIRIAWRSSSGIMAAHLPQEGVQTLELGLHPVIGLLDLRALPGRLLGEEQRGRQGAQPLEDLLGHPQVFAPCPSGPSLKRRSSAACARSRGPGQTAQGARPGARAGPVGRAGTGRRAVPARGWTAGSAPAH